MKKRFRALTKAPAKFIKFGKGAKHGQPNIFSVISKDSIKSLSFLISTNVLEDNKFIDLDISVIELLKKGAINEKVLSRIINEKIEKNECNISNR